MPCNACNRRTCGCAPKTKAELTYTAVEIRGVKAIPTRPDCDSHQILGHYRKIEEPTNENKEGGNSQKF